MKGLIVIIILLISSFSYFGVVNDGSIANGVNVQEVTQEQENTQENVEQNEVNEQNNIESVTLKSQENKDIETKDEVVENKKEDEKTESKTNAEKNSVKSEETNSENKAKTEKKETVTKTTTTEKNNNKTKNEQEENKQSDSNYTEKEVQLAPKVECVGNKHMIDSGNTGKWFNTKEEADSFYNTEIKKWGKQWENGEIEKDEYLKNCPSGYEVWTCPQCQKWTLNFYYR